MDILPKLRSLHLTRLQSRRTRLIRRWLAAGLLVLGGVLLVHPGSARGAPTVLAAPDLPSGTALRAADDLGDPGTATVPVRLADVAVAALLRPGQRVDVVAAPEPAAPASVLAGGATVVTIEYQEPSTLKGPLVLLRLPEAAATRVAAISLERPVAVTLR